MKATPSQNETIFWHVVSGAYGKAASALHRVKSGICQGITCGLNDDVNSMPAAGAGYADFLSERTWLPANQSGGGNHAGIPFSECSGGASSRTGEKRRHHDKAWCGRGITLHTAVKDDDSEAVGIIRALLAGEENARLRAAHWLHERGLKV